MTLLRRSEPAPFLWQPSRPSPCDWCLCSLTPDWRGMTACDDAGKEPGKLRELIRPIHCHLAYARRAGVSEAAAAEVARDTLGSPDPRLSRQRRIAQYTDKIDEIALRRNQKKGLLG